MDQHHKVPKKIQTMLTDKDLMKLPKGFRFHPTDEELVLHYLIPKSLNSNFTAAAISQADFNKSEPWDLPMKENMGDTERYYYCQKDRKYPSGLRTNRATKAGYWKATGKDKEIFKGVGDGKELIGMKKTLVFYKGRAPNGEKSNWVMHEFRLQQNGQLSYIPKDDGWVVSRVFHKINTAGGGRTRTGSGNNAFSPTQESDSFSIVDFSFHNTESLPDLVDPSSSSNYKRHPNAHQFIYSDDNEFNYPTLSESLLQTLDSFQYDYSDENKSLAGTTSTNFVCPSSSAIISVPVMQNTSIDNVEDSFSGQESDDFPFLSTLGSMSELDKLWD